MLCHEVRVTVAVPEGGRSGELVARTRCGDLATADSVHRGLTLLFGEGYEVATLPTADPSRLG